MAAVVKESHPSKTPEEMQEEVRDRVAEIIADVRQRGDDAVREWSAKLDDWEPESFRLTGEQIEEIVAKVDPEVVRDTRFCQEQVRRWAQIQRSTLQDVEIETLEGVWLGQKHIPMASAGTYVPAGKYPMVASAHMSNITAKVAGVPRLVCVSPPSGGEVHPVTVAAMHWAGVDEIYIIGGVQALAAMAIGTETIEAVDFIAGPGNPYVAEAKKQLFGEVGIDLLAGPTEILVIADDTADPEIVAADLLGQAEHGPTTPAWLLTTSRSLADGVHREIGRQLEGLPTADVASKSWEEFGEIRVVDSDEEAVRVADEYAPEHLEVQTRDPDWYLAALRNYGSLFLGETTTVAYGDKTIGTNHILPTNHGARYTGGLWVGKYLKTVTYQKATKEASVRIGEVCARQCRVERFEGHARSCDIRVRKFGDGR